MDRRNTHTYIETHTQKLVAVLLIAYTHKTYTDSHTKHTYRRTHAHTRHQTFSLGRIEWLKSHQIQLDWWIGRLILNTYKHTDTHTHTHLTITHCIFSYNHIFTCSNTHTLPFELLPHLYMHQHTPTHTHTLPDEFFFTYPRMYTHTHAHTLRVLTARSCWSVHNGVCVRVGVCVCVGVCVHVGVCTHTITIYTSIHAKPFRNNPLHINNYTSNYTQTSIHTHTHTQTFIHTHKHPYTHTHRKP